MARSVRVGGFLLLRIRRGRNRGFGRHGPAGSSDRLLRQWLRDERFFGWNVGLLGRSGFKISRIWRVGLLRGLARSCIVSMLWGDIGEAGGRGDEDRCRFLCFPGRSCRLGRNWCLCLAGFRFHGRLGRSCGSICVAFARERLTHGFGKIDRRAGVLPGSDTVRLRSGGITRSQLDRGEDFGGG